MVWHACQNSAIGLICSNKLLKSIGAHERGENYLIKTALSWHCVGKGFRKCQGITIIAIPPPLHHFDVLGSSFGPTLWRISPFPQCSAELAWQDSAPLKPSNWILFFYGIAFHRRLVAYVPRPLGGTRKSNRKTKAIKAKLCFHFGRVLLPSFCRKICCHRTIKREKKAAKVLKDYCNIFNNSTLIA